MRFGKKQHEFIDASNPTTLPKLENILCPVNFSPAAQTSLEVAVSLAKQFSSRLIAACVVERGDKGEIPRAKEELSSFLQQSGAAGCDVQTQGRKGEAGKEIVSLASRKKADLIVLGAQPRHPLRVWLWGDTTEFVLRQAPVPVLVVPDKGK